MSLQERARGPIGRRIVWIFLLSALVPLLAFAWISRARVAHQIEWDTETRLAQDLKAAGVTLVERLRVAAEELERLAATAPRGSGVVSLAPARRFAELRVEAPTGAARPQAAARRGATSTPVRLDPRPGATGSADLWLVTPIPAREDFLAARIDPAFLFEDAGLECPPARLSVHLENGELVRRIGEGSPPPSVLRSQGLGERVTGALAWDDGEGARRGRFWEVFLLPRFGQNLVVTVHRAEADVTAPVHAFDRDFLRIVLLTLAAVGLLSLVQIRRVLTPVKGLVQASERIAAQRFDARVPVRGSDEFAVLGRAFNAMAADLERRTTVMHTVNAFGASLSVETDMQALVGKLIHGAVSLFHVDGVLVHLVDDDGRLRVSHLCIGTRDLETTVEPGSDLAVSLGLDGATRGTGAPRRSAAFPSVEETTIEVDATLRALAHRLKYTLKDWLVLPMRDRDGEVAGALTLFNPRRGGERPGRFDTDTMDVARSLVAQATVAISNARLRDEFKGLFDALIQTIAVAVDEQSPYTGGHSRRVPEIAMQLLEKVHSSDLRPFAEVSFSENQVYEMRVAAMLHDCGKVVTPVHVIDKSTKLQTICDRIRLLEQRFETAVREAEARRLRRAAETAGVDLAQADRELATDVRRMRQDLAFLHGVNRGAEHMSDADVLRVLSISSRWTWRGLDGELRRFLEPNEEANLCIRRGTLTDEERAIVNRHVESTIRMLQQLPFPARLRDVPKIAGSHHERVDGRGFPCGLRGDEIPLQGRILAVADVFEALTARDRPYRPAKRLSEALEIMTQMARTGHLDANVFRVFLDSDIWRRYADETIDPEQRDDVDVDALRAALDTQDAGTPLARTPAPAERRGPP